MSIILNILPQYKNFIGGPTFTVDSLISESLNNSDNVIVLCGDGSRGDNVLNYNPNIFFRGISVLYYLIKIKPDVVHLHGRLHLTLPCVFYKILFNYKIRLLFTFHTQPVVYKYLPDIEIYAERERSYYSFLTPFFSFLLNHFFNITTVSSSIVDNINSYTRLNLLKYKVIPSGARKILNNNEKCKFVLDISKCNIFSVGVLTWDWKAKGYLCILEGLSNLDKNILDNIRFYVLGDGPYLKLLKDFVNEHKLSNSVIFVGNVNMQDINISKFDLYFHSGLNEGSSLSLLEVISNTDLNVFCFYGGGNEETVLNIPGVNIFSIDETFKYLNNFYSTWKSNSLKYFSKRKILSWSDIYKKYYS